MPSAGVERSIDGEPGAHSEKPEVPGGARPGLQGFGSGAEKGGEGGVLTCRDELPPLGSPASPPFFPGHLKKVSVEGEQNTAAGNVYFPNCQFFFRPGKKAVKEVFCSAGQSYHHRTVTAFFYPSNKKKCREEKCCFFIPASDSIARSSPVLFNQCEV